MNKSTRHEKILEIIAANSVETQGDLVNLLNKEGYQVTQATISRDIKELRLEKKSDGIRSIYYYPDSKVLNHNKYLRIFSECFVKIEAAGHLVVIKTVAGMAMAVAAALDSLEFKEIIGTIAGDDTIMCATKTSEDAINIVKAIKSMLKNL